MLCNANSCSAFSNPGIYFIFNLHATNWARNVGNSVHTGRSFRSDKGLVKPAVARSCLREPFSSKFNDADSTGDSLMFKRAAMPYVQGDQNF